MKNRKGFTLVELLATITILAILAVISVVAVEGTLKNSTEKAIKIQKESILSAAKAYVADNLTSFPAGTKTITLQTLIDEAYLDEVKNPNNDDETCEYDKSIVEVTRTGSKYTYAITLVCGNKTYN